MQRTISILERAAAGGLKTTDRMTIKCDDDQSGLESALAKCKAAGSTTVLILAEDDSVLRHWTKPTEDAAADAIAPAPKAPPATREKK